MMVILFLIESSNRSREESNELKSPFESPIKKTIEDLQGTDRKRAPKANKFTSIQPILPYSLIKNCLHVQQQ